MKTIIYILFIAIITMSFSCNQPSESKGDFEMGVARVNITGEDAVILDTLNVKTMVFRQDQVLAAIVECDVEDVSKDLTTSIRVQVAEATGIPYENICIAATHTHMAHPHKELAPAIVESVRKAFDNLRPVEFFSGIGQEFNVSFNRRYFMKDGSVRFNPMFLNPDIVRPAGPIDADVNFVLFREKENSEPYASLTGFALHLDCIKEYGAVYQDEGAGSRNSVSADYPYFLEESLREEFGNDFQSVFLTGCCGNINHWDFSKPGPQSGHKTKGKQIGDSLGLAIKRILPELNKEESSLAVRTRVVNVPLLKLTEEEKAKAMQVNMEEITGKSEEMAVREQFLRSVRKRKTEWVDEQNKKGLTTYPFDVQVYRFSNNTAIVTLPGEMFVEHQLTIKNFSPFENTIVMELANSSEASYVPNKKAYKQGGYEVEQARLEPGGGEMLVNAALEMLNELHIW
jgi:neutral ceramidase